MLGAHVREEIVKLNNLLKVVKCSHEPSISG